MKVKDINYYFEQAKLNISATRIKITHLQYDTSGKSGIVPLNETKAIFVSPVANFTVIFDYRIDLEKEGGVHSITSGTGMFVANNLQINYTVSNWQAFDGKHHIGPIYGFCHNVSVDFSDFKATFSNETT